jgi:phenylalanyl-tRNA synthetase alpha chain
MVPDLPTRILHVLNDALALPIASSEAFPDVEPTALKGALDSLHSREMVIYETIDREEPVLNEEAEGIVKEGSHEAKVYDAVCKALDGIKISELPVWILIWLRNMCPGF